MNRCGASPAPFCAGPSPALSARSGPPACRILHRPAHQATADQRGGRVLLFRAQQALPEVEPLVFSAGNGGFSVAEPESVGTGTFCRSGTGTVI
jgi:hypothetical protein